MFSNLLQSYPCHQEYTIHKNWGFITDNHIQLMGDLTYFKSQLKEQINLYGGKTIDSVSKNTDVVIVGDNPGSKYEKAKELGITIWNEEKLKEELNKINM